MSQIKITGLTFGYDGSYDNIFENVSFIIDTDWKLGFTGRNGRGKTTFLNLLQKKFEYSGSIKSSVDFMYFPFVIEDKTLNTIDVIDTINPNYEYWELLREMSLLDIDDDVLYRPFNTLSNGEQTKVLLAVLFLKENAFLLIDEPTNHLDLLGRELVGKYLASKKGYILVSHDRDFMDSCIDHILSINMANIEIQKGNFSSWYENYQRTIESELQQNLKLKKEIKRLEKSSREKAEWADKMERDKIGFNPNKAEKNMNRRAYIGAKSKAMNKRAKSIMTRQEDALEEKQSLLKNWENATNLKLEQLDFHNKKFVELNGVSIHYGDNQVCADISFSIEKGDRVALKGKNGSGKSSIIKLINSEKINFMGTFNKAKNLKISYICQDTSHLSGYLEDFVEENDIDKTTFFAILRQFAFTHAQFDKKIEDFSSGQKKKVLIAKSLCDKAHLHIWDEPLNYIDVISRIQLEKLILEFEPTILFVEHDKRFCENIANKIVEL